MNSLPDENSSRLVRLRPAQHRIFSAAYRAKENYFCEWLVWLGHAIYGLAFPLPWGLLGLVGQALILASIFGVTGIPPTEAQALKTRGDAYRAYQRRVSRFVPWPPRRTPRPP
jgi:steroid 5-alpha reductase family enzyme